MLLFFFSILFKTFIRPVLEYYISFLSRVKSCQRRLTKLCRPIKHLTYPQRLQSLKLPTVLTRLKRGDLILTYQFLNRMLDMDIINLFCFSITNTRGHHQRLSGRTSKLNIRKCFFTERTIAPWNQLPGEVISAHSLNSFKARLDKIL